MKIFQTKIIEYPNTTPGKITIDKGHLYIDAIDGRIEIIVLQPNNKKKMSAADFLSKDIEYKYLDIAEDYTLINPYIQYLKGIISAGFTIEFQNNCLQEIGYARNNNNLHKITIFLYIEFIILSIIISPIVGVISYFVWNLIVNNFTFSLAQMISLLKSAIEKIKDKERI